MAVHRCENDPNNSDMLVIPAGWSKELRRCLTLSQSTNKPAPQKYHRSPRIKCVSEGHCITSHYLPSSFLPRAFTSVRTVPVKYRKFRRFIEIFSLFSNRSEAIFSTPHFALTPKHKDDRRVLQGDATLLENLDWISKWDSLPKRW